MPLNEKAALGGAANLETSSQGSLDDPPINPAQQILVGLPIAGLSILPAPIPHASPWAILPTFGTRARSALAGDAGEVEAMSALSSWRALGDDVNGRGPGHSPRDRSLSVTPEPSAANGFLVHSFAGDDPTVCLDYVRARLGLPAFTPQGGAPPRKPAAGTHQALARHDSAAPIKSATVAPDNGAKASWLRAQHEPISESCPAGLKNLSNYKVLRGQTESTPPIGSKGLSGALATPGSTDPPPIKHEKAAPECDSGRGSQTSMEEGETSKHKNSLPSPNLQAHSGRRAIRAGSGPWLGANRTGPDSKPNASRQNSMPRRMGRGCLLAGKCFVGRHACAIPPRAPRTRQNHGRAHGSCRSGERPPEGHMARLRKVRRAAAAYQTGAWRACRRRACRNRRSRPQHNLGREQGRSRAIPPNPLAGIGTR